MSSTGTSPAKASPHPLDGIRAKIKRADKHLGELNGLSAEIVNQCKCRTASEYDAKSGEHVFAVRLDAPLPMIQQEFGIIAGEITHQLRSSLDHLVCRLADAAGQSNHSRLYFPILDKSTDQKGKSTFPEGKIKVVGGQALAIIKRLQPYNGTIKPEQNPLSILRDLDNADKHRTILVTIAAIGGRKAATFVDNCAHAMMLFMSGAVPNKGWVPLKDGAEVWRIPGPPDMKMDVQCPPVIAFDEVRFAKFKTVIPGLKKIRDAVVGVIDEFDRDVF